MILQGWKMIQKYYSSIIEQIYERIGRKEHNIAIAKYSNDFSLKKLQISERIKGSEDVYYIEHQFRAGELAEAYEPFLDIIKELFERYATQSLDDFMEECGVYKLHRALIKSYLEEHEVKRSEQLLLGEVDYERRKLTEALQQMLIGLSKIHPFLLVLNRAQLASRSAIVFINQLLDAEDTQNIGIVLGVNELQRMPEYMMPVWEQMMENLEDKNHIFQIGNAGAKEPEEKTFDENTDSIRNSADIFKQLAYFMDFEQAVYCLQRLERRIKFENFTVTDEEKLKIWSSYAYVSLFSKDLAKALELCEEIKHLKLTGSKPFASFYAEYMTALIYMYQGKLKEAVRTAKLARAAAIEAGMENWQFVAELLEVQAKMSGWCNIFFCADNVEINDQLIEKLIKYNYRNHMAYIYIYAYDNKPEMVAKAYKSEEQLIYFSKGISIAKEIGNEQLIYSAYQKNIMLASTNGMHEISTLYSVRTFEAMSDKSSLEVGRVFCGLGYNLCALGKNEEAKIFMDKALEVFYNLSLPEDIAEVYYNRAINCIALGEFREANDDIMRCMKVIEKLNLNSLRVCNLSKLYGLLALCNQKIGNHFNCIQYLNNCKQFLNYIIEKENVDNELGIIHDYAKCDDDMFLYYFSRALLNEEEGNEAAAFEDFGTAESHLVRAEGNQFYCYRLFRQSRIAFYEKTGRRELMDMERAVLEQYESSTHRNNLEDGLKVLDVVKEYLKKEPPKELTNAQMETLLRQESLSRAYQTKKRQMDFISTWQRLLDVTNVTLDQLLDTVMKTFLYHFTVDKAVYIQYGEDHTDILYNNTEQEISEEMLQTLSDIFEENQKGFAVSKISNNYSEHLDVVSMFGEDNVCSMVAIPYFNNGKVESIVIIYVLMKDNWHSLVNRYMLDEDDLNIYELLFREVVNALNRLNAYEQIYQMNQKLYESAVTDQLTGINNRKGFYQNIEHVSAKIRKGEMEHRFGLMFIDLDNFKGYNDTFGHDVGDLILKSMADIFVQVCGAYGEVSRYGGDEFIVFLYTDDREKIEELAKEIYVQIEKTDGFKDAITETLGEQITIDENRKISCSIGIITSHEVTTEEDINEMVKQADDLMYSVKMSTKGTYRFMA